MAGRKLINGVNEEGGLMGSSDVVILVLKGIVVVGSFASLFALCVYMFRVSTIWDTNTPHLSEMLDNGFMTSKQAIFPGLALLGLFVCLFTGLKAMLFWIPESWGLNDGEGLVQHFRGVLGAMFAVIGCGLIHSFIKRAIEETIALNILKVTIAGEREVYAATSLAQIEKLETDYEKRIKELEEEREKALKPNLTSLEHNGVYRRYKEIFMAYHALINLIELRKVTIAGERGVYAATSIAQLEKLEKDHDKRIEELEEDTHIDVSSQKKINVYHYLTSLIRERKIEMLTNLTRERRRET